MTFFFGIQPPGNPNQDSLAWILASNFSSPDSSTLDGTLLLGAQLQAGRPLAQGYFQDGLWLISYSDHMGPMGNTHLDLLIGESALYSASTGHFMHVLPWNPFRVKYHSCVPQHLKIAGQGAKVVILKHMLLGLRIAETPNSFRDQTQRYNKKTTAQYPL